jgi:hypothetical protein
MIVAFVSTKVLVLCGHDVSLLQLSKLPRYGLAVTPKARAEFAMLFSLVYLLIMRPSVGHSMPTWPAAEGFRLLAKEQPRDGEPAVTAEVCGPRGPEELRYRVSRAVLSH